MLTLAQLQEFATAVTASVTALTAVLSLWRRLKPGRQLQRWRSMLKRRYARFIAASKRRRRQRSMHSEKRLTSRQTQP
jgi:hypothetical protein